MSIESFIEWAHANNLMTINTGYCIKAGEYDLVLETPFGDKLEQPTLWKGNDQLTELPEVVQ